jgi:putative transposase
MILGPARAAIRQCTGSSRKPYGFPASAEAAPGAAPSAVMGDEAYSSRANRALLRGRRIKAVIPEPSDQIGHRKRRGSLADAL